MPSSPADACMRQMDNLYLISCMDKVIPEGCSDRRDMIRHTKVSSSYLSELGTCLEFGVCERRAHVVGDAALRLFNSR